MNRGWMLASVPASLALASVASCATNASNDQGPDEPSSAIVRGDAAAGDGGADASDASDVSCESVDWCSVPTPMTGRYTFTSVKGTSKNDVWAVGAGGTILHYDGTTWKSTQSKYLETFYDVWSDGNDVWAVSSSALMLHATGFASGAVEWTNLPIDERTNAMGFGGLVLRVHTVWGSGPDDVRIGTDAQSVSVGSPDDPLFSFVDDVNQHLIGHNDAGVVWRALPSKGAIVRSIWGTSATDVWMTVDNSPNVPFEAGMILHGTPYTGPRPNPLAREAVCIHCAANCTGCAVIDDPLLWTVVDSQSQVALESVWGSSADDVWAVGRRGTIRRIRKGEDRWQIVASPTTETLHHVWGSGPNDVWMVGDKGTILHFDGTTITPSSARFADGPLPDLRGVWGSGPDDVWIVGEGIALHYTGPRGTR